MHDHWVNRLQQEVATNKFLRALKQMQRFKTDEEIGAKRLSAPLLIQVVTVLIFFVSGVVFGFLATAYSTGYFKTNSDWFFPVTVAYQKVGCVMENFTTFLSPGNLTHTMTDEQLFWRASMVPRKEQYPYKRVPKVAFLFLTRGPLPLVRIWERFFEGYEEFYSIYVHALPGYKLNVSMSSPFYNREIPSEVVRWGTIELADAERRLLSNALLDFSNERFVLVSESCIPIYNFNTVYKYLLGSRHSFVQSYDDPSNDGRGRYNPHMAPEITLDEWRKGSQWFELNRVLAVIIVSDTKYFSLFTKYCKPPCYPDEHYLATYLSKFFPSLIANRSVTYVDWSIKGPHPASFGKTNITAGFIDYLRNNGTTCQYNLEVPSVCYLFARKFTSSALEPLLNLTSKVMQF